MRPSEAVVKYREALLDIARRHGVSNVRLFGSTSRGEDAEGSDIDLLVDPSADTSLLDLARIKLEAEDLTGIPFDIRTPLSLSRRFRDSVLRDAIPL
jgi:predicted nucleotidyltransferase